MFSFNVGSFSANKATLPVQFGVASGQNSNVSVLAVSQLGDSLSLSGESGEEGSSVASLISELQAQYGGFSNPEPSPVEKNGPISGPIPVDPGGPIRGPIGHPEPVGPARPIHPIGIGPVRPVGPEPIMPFPHPPIRFPVAPIYTPPVDPVGPQPAGL